MAWCFLDANSSLSNLATAGLEPSLSYGRPSLCGLAQARNLWSWTDSPFSNLAAAGLEPSLSSGRPLLVVWLKLGIASGICLDWFPFSNCATATGGVLGTIQVCGMDEQESYRGQYLETHVD